MKTETKPTETAGNASVSAIVADNGSFPVPTPNAAKTLIECLEALAETAPDNRSPYTCREIAAALEEQFSVGYRAGIAEIYKSFGYVSDPHSTVGYLSYRDCGASGWWLSTAHAAKFGKVIEESIGIQPCLPDEFKRILSLPRHSEAIEADGKALKAQINKLFLRF